MSDESESELNRSRRNRSSRRSTPGETFYEYDGDADQTGGSSETRERQQRRRRAGGASARSSRRRQALPEPMAAQEFQMPFDPWRLFEAMRQKWSWLAMGFIGFGLCAFFFGLWAINYTLKLDLIRRETSNAFRSDQAAESYMPRAHSDQTLISIMMTQDVMKRTATNLVPQMDPNELRGMIRLTPGAMPDVVTLTVADKGNLPRMVQVANTFAKQAIEFTREIQAAESGIVNGYLTNKLAMTEAEIADLNEAQRELAKSSGFYNLEKEVDTFMTQVGGLDLKLETARTDLELLNANIKAAETQLAGQTPANSELDLARKRLAVLHGKRYSEQHPEVIAERATIARLEKEPVSATAAPTTSFAVTGAAAMNPAYLQLQEFYRERTLLEKQIRELTKIQANASGRVQNISAQAMELATLKARMSSLTMQRESLARRQQETQLFVESALGYYKPLDEVGIGDVRERMRWMKIGFLTACGALLGLITAGGLVMLTEAFDTRIKTSDDLQRATGLPVLATLGDTSRMKPEEISQWAFRTLTILRGKMTGTPDDGIVCGFISSAQGEGRSTWINLLVEAASKRGLRVLTVDARPGGQEPEISAVKPHASVNGKPDPKLNGRPTDHVAKTAPVGATVGSTAAEPEEEEGVRTAVLETAEGTGEDPQKKESFAVMQAPEEGWVWSLERRKQWQSAMTKWQAQEFTVLLIEVPPANEPEALLIAENLPQLIWLSRSGVADSQETARQVETLRAAKCNLVGAVLNDEGSTLWNRYGSRWFKRAAAIALMATTLWLQGPDVVAQQTSGGSTNQVLALSSGKPQQRAEWQKRLTLGPGDIIDLHLIGRPELSRTNIFIGADGNLTYLQARNVRATGLTIDELRAHLDGVLGELYSGARTIIQPVAYNSKKYYVLGKVAARGAYTLDRPITLVEAVARAKGLETGLYQRNTVELADLSRSFLVRDGKKLDIDFQKLFFEGDLSQNVLIEPGDYIFFPGAGVNEIYILGEVFNPGPLGFAPNATMITAITDRGGFTEKAFRKKVLVIRGSLTQPETFVVDVGDIFYARSEDFRLQPKDIVYVSRRPWARVEELLDEAAQSFIQGALTAWTGVHVGPIIRRPILPD